MDDIEKLDAMQAEAKEWTKRNFPNQPSYHPLLGMVEELGEFCEAKNESDVQDALADFMIFTTNFCTHCSLSISALWQQRFTSLPSTDSAPFPAAAMPALQMLHIAVGRIAHHRLKYEQKIRGDRAEHLCRMSDALCLALASVDALLPDVVGVTFRVWREHVQPRNWVPLPESAR